MHITHADSNLGMSTTTLYVGKLDHKSENNCCCKSAFHMKLCAEYEAHTKSHAQIGWMPYMRALLQLQSGVLWQL